MGGRERGREGLGREGGSGSKMEGVEGGREERVKEVRRVRTIAIEGSVCVLQDATNL